MPDQTPEISPSHESIVIDDIPSGLRIGVKDDAIPGGFRHPLAKKEIQDLTDKINKYNALIDCMGA